jgi:hypothetical protein
MPRLMKGKYSSIERLLDRRLRKKGDPSQELIDELSHIKLQAYFDKPEFLRMCSWKSPRPRRLYESNSDAEIRSASVRVFAAKCEREKVELLTSLRGVGIPTASAILTLTDPDDYGVIDIRVWQLLYNFGAVANRPSGTGFSSNNWLEYLQALRFWARKFDATARDVEIVLFDYHKEKQEGTLYPARPSNREKL